MMKLNESTFFKRSLPASEHVIRLSWFSYGHIPLELKMTAAATSNAVASKDAIAARIGFYGSAATTALFNVASTTIPASAYTFTGNNAVDAANIASTANKDLATALGITLDAYNKGFAYTTVSLIDQPNTATTVNGERYTTDAALTAASTDTGTGVDTVWSTSMSGTFTLAVGTNSVTVSLGGAYGGSNTTSTITDIETAVKAAWATTYGAAGTSSESAIATLTGADDGKIEIEMLQTDSAGFGKAVTFTANSTSSVDTRTSGNIDHVIGLTKSDADNSTIATAARTGLIITMTSNDAGTDLNKVSGVVDASSGSASLGTYSTDYTTNTTYDTSTYASTQVERTDVRSAEGSVAGTANTAAAATTFNRVAWLG
jgi:hypothetical protein